MICANLASYPPRRASLLEVVALLAPQVDRLNVVLNQYETVPGDLAAFANVVPVIPPRDLKDVGKFYPDISGADLVFLVDDDIRYPADFVATAVAAFHALPPGRTLAGYHGSIYRRPKKDGPPIPRALIADHRRILNFSDLQAEPLVVDQIATCACLLRAADLPGFAYMESAQQFVDVRLAGWCFDQGILPVSLPRPERWLTPIWHPETIYRGFTRTNPAHVAEEIWHYAFKRPGRGKPPATPAAPSQGEDRWSN